MWPGWFEDVFAVIIFILLKTLSSSSALEAEPEINLY